MLSCLLKQRAAVLTMEGTTTVGWAGKRLSQIQLGHAGQGSEQRRGTANQSMVTLVVNL